MTAGIMADMSSDKPIGRSSALVTLGSAGLGLLAMQWAPVSAAELKDGALAKLLPQFQDRSRAQLLRLLKAPGFSGHIPAPEVAQFADSERKNVDALMVELLPLARTYARP